MKYENKRQLTTVKVVLRKAERRSFYPLISSLGVKMGVNIVNIIKSPLNFQSRREISWIMGGCEPILLISKKHSGTAQACQC